MNRQSIPIEQFQVYAHGLWDKQWLLLSSGDFDAGRFNCMTVSWGSLGVMWNKPFAQVVVRPVRYTFQFMQNYPTFTLCAFPEHFRPALNLLGTTTGRKGDKIAAAGLTPEAATHVAAPVYVQAELTIECRKMYWQDIDPAHFLYPELERNYPNRDYHRIYYGEIVAITQA